MKDNRPEEMTREIIHACADCDICRYLMDGTPCLVFPELYRLADKEAKNGEKITPAELRNLVDLCNFCALCPCSNVRADLMKAKHAFVERDGIKPTVRLLEDVERLANICGAYPQLTNTLFQSGLTGGILKSLAGIHHKRKMPVFPKDGFTGWAKDQGLHVMRGGNGRKIAYFAGCTGRFLFPDVPKAVVDVLRRNGIEVYYPEQKCCGMPSLLEGDQPLTHEFAGFNVERLSEAVEHGYDIVCSCPTCGYMLKSVLSEGACHSAEYREAAGGGEGDEKTREGTRLPGRVRGGLSIKSPFQRLFKDDGYFASIDARKRMEIAAHTYDLGEYLQGLRQAGELNTHFGPVPAHMAYYPPCHLREQKIGEPYADLLALVPGVSLDRIEGSFYCCGIAGIMGFKRDFHEASIAMGERLMEKIKEIDPERLLCDCLSCRLQFNQLTNYEVHHPAEILSESYANHG